ncbi:MAG: ATP-binding protein [Chloroflexi bacterium]|nr:MAG: ATP-binding protein [Chloroflexota bacterium]
MAEEASKRIHFPIHSLIDVIKARRQGLEIAIAMGFPQAEANKVAVVISELGRNIELYAGEGSITLTTYTGRGGYIEVVAEDRGPGIPDLDLVLDGGYTTSNGLGLGISGSRRLMDEFEIQSTVGQGTKIRALKRLR